MKSKLFICFALLSILTTSCTSDADANLENPMASEADNYEKTEYAEFLHALDSLNSLSRYQKGTTRSVESVVATKIADAIGTVIGNKAGTQVGAAIGSASGNPLIAIAGYLAGRKYGGKVVGSIFSSVVGIFGDIQVQPNSYDGVVIPEDSLNICYYDSIGIGHNMAMGYFYSNKQSYINNVYGSADLGQLYDDCVDILVADDVVKDTFYNMPSIKNQVISWAHLTSKHVKVYLAGGISYQDFLLMERDMLVNKVGMDLLEARFYIDLCDELTTATSNMTTNEIKSYGLDLKDLIDSSSLDTETKEDVYSTVNILLSSAICWQGVSNE